VIVIPESGGRLAVGIDGGARVELRSVGAIFALRGEPCFGIAVVIRHGAGAVEVRDVADRRERRFSSVDGVIDRKKMRWGELADPVDAERLAALGFDGWTGPGSVISPEGCWREISMHLLLKLAHFEDDDLA
jgi:hypothetical protein